MTRPLEQVFEKHSRCRETLYFTGTQAGLRGNGARSGSKRSHSVEANRFGSENEVADETFRIDFRGGAGAGVGR
jgi:hypothetical protein